MHVMTNQSLVFHLVIFDFYREENSYSAPQWLGKSDPIKQTRMSEIDVTLKSCLSLTCCSAIEYSTRMREAELSEPQLQSSFASDEFLKALLRDRSTRANCFWRSKLQLPSQIFSGPRRTMLSEKKGMVASSLNVDFRKNVWLYILKDLCLKYISQGTRLNGLPSWCILTVL